MREVLLVGVLQLLGVVIVLAEFLIPSAGILTVSAIVAFGFSLYLMYVDVSPQAAMILGAADLALVPVLAWVGVRILARSPAALRSKLSRDDGAVSQDLRLEALVGKTGKALSILRPAGRALIDGQRLDVVTTGDFIDPDTDIVVTEVNGNRIVVKRGQTT